MDELTQQQLRDQFQSLPEVVRSTISDPATYEAIERVGLAQGLTKVEAGLLAQATSLLMMGFIEPNKYVSVLIDQLSVSQEVAAIIAQEINRDIFNKIKDALKEVHGIAKASTAPVPSSVFPQKTAPSNFATPSAASPMATPKIEAPVSPSPLTATLDVAAMKTEMPVAVRTMPVPPKVPQTAPAEAMRTITVDQLRTPATTPQPTMPVPTTSIPTPPMSSMNIFEEKLGSAFRIKSDSVIATPNYSGSAAPSAPTPLPSIQAAVPTPVRPSASPMIGVVPAPTVPRPIAQPVSAPATPTSPAAMAPEIQRAPQPTAAPLIPPPSVTGADQYREKT